MKNSRNFFQTYSGHEKILDKFWTNKTGHIPDMKIFWTISGHIPDKFRMSEAITFWNIFRTINSVRNLYIIIPNIFRTFSGHSVFIGLGGSGEKAQTRKY